MSALEDRERDPADQHDRAAHHPPAAAPGARAGSLDAWRELVHGAERQELVDTVRRRLETRVGIAATRACYETGGEPADAWAEVADYASIGLPESVGGLGTLVDTAAMIEAAGRELLPVPLLATVTAWHTLLAAAAGAGSDGLEPELGRRAALGVVDAPGGGRGAGTVVVLDGASAERLVLVAPRGRGTTVAVVDPATLPAPVVHRHVDAARPVAEHDVRDPTPLACVDSGIGVDEILAPARTLVAADLTGVAAGALDRAVRHALERHQFGKPIGAFQGVKHRLADVDIALERARSLTRAAAVALGAEGTADGAELSLLAKASAAEAAVDATRALVQVQGAMGMTAESDAHLFFRRAQQTAPFLGSAVSCYRGAARRRRATMEERPR